MLKPRFFVARPLVVAAWLGLIATMSVWGCQGPDTFIRKGTGGSGVAGRGSGGSSFGSGGSFGAGGFIGAGGSSFGAGGSLGQGGTGMGGRIGTGGTASGGTTGSGGARDGGSDASGAGGVRDAGSDARGAGGSIGVDANPDSEGGVIGGTGPCAGLCAPAIAFTLEMQGGNDYHTGNIGVGEGCYETTEDIHGVVCSSFDTNGNRMLSINGTADPTCSFSAVTFPKVNGGYCLQISAGNPDFAGVAVF